MKYLNECMPMFSKEEQADWLRRNINIRGATNRYRARFLSGCYIYFYTETANQLECVLLSLSQQTGKQPPPKLTVIKNKLPAGGVLYTETDYLKGKEPAPPEHEPPPPSGEGDDVVAVRLTEIRDLLAETCGFIKTLTIALNGKG